MTAEGATVLSSEEVVAAFFLDAFYEHHQTCDVKDCLHSEADKHDAERMAHVFVAQHLQDFGLLLVPAPASSPSGKGR